MYKFIVYFEGFFRSVYQDQSIPNHFITVAFPERNQYLCTRSARRGKYLQKQLMGAQVHEHVCDDMPEFSSIRCLHFQFSKL